MQSGNGQWIKSFSYKPIWVQIESIHNYTWYEIIYAVGKWAASSFSDSARLFQSKLSLMTRPLDAFIPVCWKFTHKRENWRACDMTHWLGILGSCAAHEELESPAPAAGLAFLEPVSNGREAKNEVFVWRKRRRAADWEASASGWRIIIIIIKKSQKYLSVYVVRLRWRRRVAFSLTKVRPVGSNVHIRVMHTLSMTSQLQTTMPAKNSGASSTSKRGKAHRARRGLHFTHLKPGFWQWHQSTAGNTARARQFPPRRTPTPPREWLHEDQGGGREREEQRSMRPIDGNSV